MIDEAVVSSPALLGLGGPTTPAGAGTPQRALAHSVVYRCTFKIADTIASFPCREVIAGVEVKTPSPVVRDPWPGVMSRSAWLGATAASMALRGAAYWLAEGDNAHRGVADSLALLNPDVVAWHPDKGWSVDGDPVELWPLGPLVAVPWRLLPGSPVGLNPLQYARTAIYTGLAANEWGGQFFSGGTVPRGLLIPERNPGPDGAARLKVSFANAAEGREIAVLPGSVKFQPLSVSADDAALIDSVHLSDEQVARFFGLPPTEVGVMPTGNGSTMTYQNRTAAKADLLEALLLPLRRIEEAWSAVTGGRREVRLITAGLLRAADPRDRYAAYNLAIEGGYMTPAEARLLEDMPPMPAA